MTDTGSYCDETGCNIKIKSVRRGGNIVTYREIILKEIEEVPADKLEEVIDFIRYLKIKTLKEKRDVTIASESSLKKDWLSPEEDEVWKDL